MSVGSLVLRFSSTPLETSTPVPAYQALADVVLEVGEMSEGGDARADGDCAEGMRAPVVASRPGGGS